MDKCIDCEFFVRRGELWDCSVAVCPYEEEYESYENTEDDYPNIDDI